MKQMKVDAIKNGTVIDHIPAGKGLLIADILNVNEKDVVMIGVNLQSKKIERKDIIKIENRELTSRELNCLALIAPQSTVTQIKAYKVDKKIQVELQNKIEDLVICPNPKCITNMEKMKSRFHVFKTDQVVVRCAYCEKNMQLMK